MNQAASHVTARSYLSSGGFLFGASPSLGPVGCITHHESRSITRNGPCRSPEGGGVRARMAGMMAEVPAPVLAEISSACG
eukprot:scaffold15717_cov72-Isochrysis_galbana.AAC.1